MADTFIRVQKDKNNPYVILNKDFLSDERMSWRAKGILAYLLSKPDNWTIVVKDLVKKSTEGRDAVYNCLKELETYGYMQRKQERNEKGKLGKMEYIIYEKPLTDNQETDTPHTEKPYTDKPETEKPYTENPTLLNNDILLTNDLAINQSDQIEFESIDDMLQHYSAKFNLPVDNVQRIYDKCLEQYKAGNVTKFTPYFEKALKEDKIDYERLKFSDG